MHVRVLIIEDSQADAELALRHLRMDGIECAPVRVETEEAFLAAIREGRCDLILSDFSLPLERFEQCSCAHPGKDRQTRLHRRILDTTSAKLYAAKRSQIAHRVLPETQRFSTRDIVPIFQPTGLLWLGDRLGCRHRSNTGRRKVECTEVHEPPQ